MKKPKDKAMRLRRDDDDDSEVSSPPVRRQFQQARDLRWDDEGPQDPTCNQCKHPDHKGIHTCGRDGVPERERPTMDDSCDCEGPHTCGYKQPVASRPKSAPDLGTGTRPPNRVLVECPDCAAFLLVEAIDPDDELPPLKVSFLKHRC